LEALRVRTTVYLHLLNKKWFFSSTIFDKEPKIDKFVNGLKRDMQAVRNAIIYEYNNGLAEGSVNKLKVIKRITYGRNKFEMLRQKVLLLENNG